MVEIVAKESTYIVTINPQNKEEAELLQKIKDYTSRKATGQSEYDYWTFGNKTKDKQLSFDSDGFISIQNEDDIPFLRKA